MSNAYKLDAENEGQRLEEQTKNKNYSLVEEFKISGVNVENGEKILDAGCGTGILSRSLVDIFHWKNFSVEAVDMTESLLSFAKNESMKKSLYQERIHFSLKNICELESENLYDKIFSRYVFQHISSRMDQLIAANALYLALKVGGSLFVTDCFGFFSHMDTTNFWLKNQIELVENKMPIDMNVGIKLRGLFLDSDIPPSKIQCFKQNFEFDTKEQRDAEAALWEQRFINARSLLISILGEVGAVKFSSEYVKEIKNPRTYIQATKIILRVNK